MIALNVIVDSLKRSMSPVFKKLKAIGPGALTAAAFIGPGTVTTATVAGATYGYALVWALVFATIAAIILQEMALRLGVAGRLGLGEAITRSASRNPALKLGATVLILAALYVGNAAYEGGNIAGAALGLNAALGLSQSFAAFIVSVCAGLILIFGGYKTIERFLIGAVLIMTVAFAAGLMIVGPDWRALGAGAVTPSIPAGALPLAIGLLGTTIVPYNLFLHAAAARKRWSGPEGLSDARFDARLSIGLGGVVSILVLSTAAASLFGQGIEVVSAAQMAKQLEPAFGAAAVWLLSTGLLAAGLSSAVTAPLATGFAAAELFGFSSDPKAPAFRAVAISVLIIGAGVAISGIRPVEVILFAQIANGLLLPIVAVFLLVAANRKTLLGQYANGPLANAAGVVVVLIAAGLGIRTILRAIGVL